jgi:hypothetical protein
MKGGRGHPSALLLALVPLVLLGCTGSNPEFIPPNEAGNGCVAGRDRRCRASGQVAQVCVPARQGDTETTGFVDERTCPAGSSCQSGYCIAGATQGCGADCSGTTSICTIFVNGSNTSTIGTYCAAPLGSKAGGASCTKASECASGFCIRSGTSLTCYQSCGKGQQCSGGHTCTALSVTVQGVSGTVYGCL